MKAFSERIQQLQWQKLDRLSALILVLLILWLCWKLASLFWWVVAPPQVMQVEQVELGSKQAQIPNISGFALFNEPAATTAANDNQTFELQGVMIGYPNRFSSAVIKVDDKAERYRVGDTLDNSAYQLSEVYWDHVVLQQGNGATREVRFKGLENGLYQPVVSPEQSAQATPAPQSIPPSPNAAIGQAIQQMQQNRDQYLQNMGMSAGGSGYEVTDNTPSALRNTLGLRPGDRILSVNGQSVGQGQNDVQLLEQVRREGQVKIEIKRGDQVMTIQQSFK